MNLKRAICPFLLSSVIVGLSSCSGESDQAGQSPETVRKLSVLAVQPARVPDLLETVGTVSAVQTSSLASQMMGTILEIRDGEGDRVQRGQVLAVIDDSQPRAAMDRAIAAYDAAQQQLAAAEGAAGNAGGGVARAEPGEVVPLSDNLRA